jgi:hypothetical protein
MARRRRKEIIKRLKIERRRDIQIEGEAQDQLASNLVFIHLWVSRTERRGKCSCNRTYKPQMDTNVNGNSPVRGGLATLH